jgi:hypothetical protein
MKWLFGLLIFANAAFWAYARIDVPPPAVDFKSREINADKLSVVPVEQVVATPSSVPVEAARVTMAGGDKGQDKPKEGDTGKAEPKADDKAASDNKGEAKAEPKKAEETGGKQTLACFSWRGILADDLPNVRKKLAELKLGGESHLQAAEGGDAKVRYWVYIPPRGSASEAQKKGDELKSLGVTDYFVVNDGGRWQNAISLGLFANRDSAERRLNSIREQGVRSAQMQERNEGGGGGNTMVLKQIPKSARAALEKAAQGFRGSSIGEGC